MSIVSNYMNGHGPKAAAQQYDNAGTPAAANPTLGRESGGAAKDFEKLSLFQQYKKYFVIGGVSAFIVFYLLVQAGMDAASRKVASAFAGEGSDGSSVVIADEFPAAPREDRKVENADSGAGIFGKYFCRGGRSSELCQ